MVESPRPMDGFPMFPLGQPLLPTTGMALHVFEPRYRQMVIDCLGSDADPPEIGIVLIERGWEVGGGDERALVGVRAEMRALQALDGGRYAFMAIGVGRLRVVEWLPDDPYPRARVEAMVDPDVGDPTLLDLLGAARAHAEVIRTLLARSGVAVPAAYDTDDRPETGLFQLAGQLPIGPADRQGLIEATSVRERSTRLEQAMDDLESMLRFNMT